MFFGLWSVVAAYTVPSCALGGVRLYRHLVHHGDVGEPVQDQHPHLKQERLRVLLELGDLLHQESHVVDGEALQDVGEAWLQVTGLVVKHKHTRKVAWNNNISLWCSRGQS